MRLRRSLSWIALGTLAVLLLAFGWLWFADLGVFKPQIERWVSAKTGREFSIDGDLSIDVARHSAVVAEGVRLRNADWADRPDMVSIARIEVRVDLWSLVSGPIIVELIDVDDAQVFLQLTENDGANWSFPPTESTAAAAAEESRGIDLLLRHIDIARSSLTYASFQRDQPLELVVASLRQDHRDDGFLDVGLDATLNGKVARIDGEAGTWDDLLTARNIRFDLSATLDTLQVSARGTIDDVVNPRRPAIEFTATAPDIDDVTRLLGIGDEGEGDIHLEGSVGTADDGLVHFALNGNVGRTEIESSGDLTDLRDYGVADVELRASGPDLGRILRLAGVHNVRDAPFEITVDAERRGPMFSIRKAEGSFAGTTFAATARLPRFPHADEGEAELHIAGPAIERLLHVTGLPAPVSGPFDVNLAVSSGDSGPPDLTLDAASPLGKARVRGTVGPAPAFAGSEFEVAFEVGSVSKVALAHGLTAQMPDWPARLQGSFAVDDGSLRTVGPASLDLGDHDATFDGRLVFADGLAGSRADVKVHGASLADIVGGFASPEYVPAQPYTLTAAVFADARGLRIRNAAGSIGTAAVEGDGLLTFASGIAGTRFSANVRGPALEDFDDSFAGINVRAGAFRLSGAIDFSADAIALENVALERPGGSARLNLQIGRAAQGRWMKFDANASGRDVHAVFQGKEGFELLALPFSVSVGGDHHGDRWSFVNAKATIGDATASADGVIDLRGATSSASFELQVAIPSLATFGRFAGRGFRDQALSLDADIRGGDGVLSAKQFHLKVGDSDVYGDLAVKAGEVPEIELAVNSTSVVVEPLLEDPETPAEPIALKGDGRMIPDVAMPFDALARFNAAFDIGIGHFRFNELVLQNVELDATVQNGVLDVPHAEFDAVTGSARARLRLDPAGGSGSGLLQIAARDLYMGLLDKGAAAAPRGDWDVNLEFTGTTLRSMLAGADGIVFIRRFGGQLNKGNRFLQALYGDLLEQILNTINPFRVSEAFTPIRCIVVSSEIAGGKLISAPSSLVTTDKLLIVINSSVDLATEKINVGFRTEPLRRFSVSAAELINPYIAVVGTMAAPRLAVDQKGVLITGGAAVATGGLTILAQGLWSRLSRSSDPCDQAVTAGMETLGARLPKLDVPVADTP